MTFLSRPAIYDAAAITAGTIDADDTNITGDQWARLWVRDGGVDSGMGLTLSSVSDVATVGTGIGVWRGFILTVSAAHDLNVPAVTAAKTYSIGVLYDPANHSAAAGPLSLEVYDKASIPLPTGGGFWTLWEIDRLPSTVLSSSVIRTYRHGRGNPVIYVATLPVASQYTFGQVAVTDQSVYVRNIQGGVAAWRELSDDTGEITAGFTPSGGWTNPGCSYRKEDGITTIHIRATRSGASITASSTGSLTDVPVMTVPTGARSVWLEPGRGSLTLGASNQTFGVDWRLSAAGLFTLTSTNPNVTIDAGTTVYATVVLR